MHPGMEILRIGIGMKKLFLDGAAEAVVLEIEVFGQIVGIEAIRDEFVLGVAIHSKRP